MAQPQRSMRFALPKYVKEDLQTDPYRIQEYLQAQNAENVLRMACTATDLQLLPLVQERVERAHIPAQIQAARDAKDEAVLALQQTESSLRNMVCAALGEESNEDDLAQTLDTFVQHAADAVPRMAEADEVEQKKLNAGLISALSIARACTKLLAEADEACAEAEAAPRDACVQITTLERLSALLEQVPYSTLDTDATVLQHARATLILRRDTHYKTLEAQYLEALRAVLREMHWPLPEFQNPDHGRDAAPDVTYLVNSTALKDAWADVCELQFAAASLGFEAMPSCARHLPSVARTEMDEEVFAQPGSDSYVPLLAVKAFMDPVLLRFRFHFDGDRSTNRLDKPEWFLSHMLQLIQMNAPLFSPAPDPWTQGGPVAELTRFRRPSPHTQTVRARHIDLDTPAELLHTMLYPLRKKIDASMQLLVHQPALLAHNIFQYLTFDTDLREVYKPTVLVADGRGAVRLADHVLGNDTWFQEWLDGERVFVQRRFEALLDEPGAWSLVQADTLTDEDEQDVGSAMESTALSDAPTTTRCAGTLMRILLSVTERYQPLHLLGQRCAFVIHVQRPLLSSFHTRLARHLDAIENMNGSFARAIPGEITSLATSSANDAVRGTNGIGRIAKALLSAAYVKQQLEEWSETSFFLGMGQDIASLDKSSPLYKIMLPSHASDELDSASLISALKWGIQRGASAAATLRPLSLRTEQDSVQETGDVHCAGVWDAFMAQFGEIAHRSERDLERLVVSEVLEQLKPYIMRRWDREDQVSIPTDEDEEASEELARDTIPTRELLPALAKLASLLEHLVRVLPPAQLLPVYRQIANAISNAVVDRILMPSVYCDVGLPTDARVTQQFAPGQATRFQQDVQQGWMHVVQGLQALPKISARRAKGSATGLGRSPQAPWRRLVEASEQI
ncbi:hypothetical protein MVES1_001291 [Malassezia vespertilionis]|uniref:Uncharacterized protein n=1 Tax=Malassezia vespertilionis TaxID=2020962 RepID=A0A2N1JF26_9BASI|nr:uncharacterized protein MVES1_001291 [Malassezia vespertilionis]PKI85149.1 hypothetical protein MVES_001213 [Malassezia vespertilionis]WFD05955.1 hypothetical protein MVES1_001291 [Malassezia vespertilionis]